MTNSKSPSYALLRELALLLDKFGADAFAELAKMFSDPDLAHDIASVLAEVASRAPKARPRKRRPSAAETRAAFRTRLVQLRQEEPQRGRMLLELYDVLHSKSACPTLRELKAFISDHGLEVPKAKSRDKALMAFVNTCSSLPVEDLTSLLAELQPAEESGDRTLADWGKVILSEPRNVRGRMVDAAETATEQEDGQGR